LPIVALRQPNGEWLRLELDLPGHSIRLRGVCLSLPAIVDRSGSRRVLPIPLADEEIARLRRSADAVRDAVSHAGF
jgi:malate/lactate dehydrogenase